MTIEDETGFANLVVFENLFEKFRKEILQSRLMMVEGKLQIEGEVIHVIVKRCYNFSSLLRTLTPRNNENLPLLTLAYADEKSIPSSRDSQDPNPASMMRKRFFIGEEILNRRANDE